MKSPFSVLTVSIDKFPGRGWAPKNVESENINKKKELTQPYRNKI